MSSPHSGSENWTSQKRNKDEEDPEPNLALINLDTKRLISEMIDVDRLREAEETAKSQVDKAAKASKELESQRDLFLKELAKLEENLQDKSSKIDQNLEKI